MKAVVQRVAHASVNVDDTVVGEIQRGYLVLLGVAEGDGPDDVSWMARKIARLRLFPDPEGRMNLDLAAIDGAVLLVSQFTLLGDCRKGNRPSFVAAAAPETARTLYEQVAKTLSSEHGVPVETGQFQASMAVELLNDGPVTVLIDSSDQS